VRGADILIPVTGCWLTWNQSAKEPLTWVEARGLEPLTPACKLGAPGSVDVAEHRGRSMRVARGSSTVVVAALPCCTLMNYL
jgi:hypothetical protein